MVDSEDKDAVGLDPHQLLRALGSLLNSCGGAKGVPEILRIASLMKDAKKLVARCVYANILKCTTDSEVMEKFVQVGGWETLNIWLQDAKAIGNVPFIEELLHVYQNVPVTIELLKQNNCAKTIKQMSKSGDESLMKPCGELVDRWMETIKSQPVPKQKSSDIKKHKHKSSSDKKHKQLSSKSEKPERGEKSSRNSDSRSEKSKSTSSEKVKNSSSKESSKSETAVDRLKGSSAKSVDSRRSSDSSSVTSQSSSSSLPTSSKSEKQKSGPVKASSVLSSSSVSDKNKKVTLDNANKVKTSKTAPTKFRSTGLEQEVVLPPSKKKKPHENKLPVKRPSPLPKPPSEPPEKKPKSSPSGKEKISMVTQEEIHGKIKLIPPKPKPVEVFESSGFMDAITAINVPSVKLKRKKASNSASAAKLGVTTSTASTSNTATSPPHTAGASSPTSPKPNLPSFYKDTLASPTEKSAKLDDSKNGGETPAPPADGDVKEENKENKEEDAASVAESDLSTQSSVKDAKKKKKVTWAAEKELRSYHYFELDETERVNVNKVKNFEEIKKQEMAMERMRLENIKKMSAEENAGSIPWRTPTPISDLPEALAVPGCNSTERETQKLREESVLQVIFFSKHASPATPTEADPEDVAYEEPTVMPLDDESGESVIDHTNAEEPAPADSQPFSLSPEVARMLQNMAQQADESKCLASQTGENGNAAALMPSAEELANLPPDMQSMLQSFMGNKDQSSNELINKLKTILEPFNNQVQGTPQYPTGGFGQYPVPGQQSLLPTPPPVMYPPNLMYGVPPLGHRMAGPPMPYQGPPGRGMYRRGGPRGSLLGPGPMRGPMPMRGPRGPRGPRSGPRMHVRHYHGGDRGFHR